MDHDKFAALSRTVSEASTRRGAIKAMVAGLVAAPIVAAGRNEAEAGVPIVSCKVPGQTCQRNRNCCSNHCVKGICDCAGRGHRCWEPLRGALCCSGRCRNGKCK